MCPSWFAGISGFLMLFPYLPFVLIWYVLILLWIRQIRSQIIKWQIFTIVSFVWIHLIYDKLYELWNERKIDVSESINRKFRRYRNWVFVLLKNVWFKIKKNGDTLLLSQNCLDCIYIKMVKGVWRPWNLYDICHFCLRCNLMEKQLPLFYWDEAPLLFFMAFWILAGVIGSS